MLYMKCLFVSGSLLDHLWYKIIPHLSVVSRLLALGKRLYVFLRLESICIFLFPGLLCLIITGMFEVVIVTEITSISFLYQNYSNIIFK